MNTSNKYSFKKGWLQVTKGDAKKIRAQLMVALKVYSRTSFGDRVNGKVIPDYEEVKAIKLIFSSHGITDIWDNNIEE